MNLEQVTKTVAKEIYFDRDIKTNGSISVYCRVFAHLQQGGPSVQELESGIGGVDAAAGEDRKPGQRVADRRHVTEGDRADRVARHSAVRGAPLDADVRPRHGVRRPNSHQTRHRVGRRYSVSPACQPHISAPLYRVAQKSKPLSQIVIQSYYNSPLWLDFSSMSTTK